MLTKKEFTVKKKTTKEIYDEQLNKCYKNLNKWLNGDYNNEIINRSDNNVVKNLCEIDINKDITFEDRENEVIKMNEYIKNKVKDNNVDIFNFEDCMDESCYFTDKIRIRFKF